MTDCPKCKGKGEVDGLGVRECFVPRPGCAFVDVDYPSLELRTLAQVCYWVLGRSTLGDFYAADPLGDPHSQLAGQILGISYEEAKKRKKEQEVDDARQSGKVANFGYPGGLGAKRFCHFAYKSYGVRMKDPTDGTLLDPDDPRAIREAEKLKANWEATWPEMDRRAHDGYFAWIRSLKQPDDTHSMDAPGTGVRRAGMTYTEACNNPFQHLGAACAKRGLWLVTRACYTGRAGLLYGARVVNCIHDQLLVEVPYVAWGPDRTHEAAYEVARLFEAGAKEYLPDVPIPTEPCLTMCWSKKAESRFDSERRLIPWTEAA